MLIEEKNNSLASRFNENKPWAWLRMSRQQYERQRIWKKLKMSRRRFDSLVLLIPPEVIEHIIEEARADMLVEAIFKGLETDAPEDVPAEDARP